jgi:hypothetical protein
MFERHPADFVKYREYRRAAAPQTFWQAVPKVWRRKRTEEDLPSHS